MENMTPKYPKGSKVRCISDSEGGGFHEGGVYTVREDFYDGGSDRETVSVELDDAGSTYNGWFQNNFEPVEPVRALSAQVGGTHYTDMKIQPATYNLANGLGWAEGDAVSYISRWRSKGGLQDLRKARQTLLLLIEHEESIGTE